MSEILLWLFILICAGLISWGLTRSAGVYQYPFLAGLTFFVFILPQAVSIVNEPGVIPEVAVQRVLVMSCLCAAMSWGGYQLKIPTAWLKRNQVSLNINKLKVAAGFYVGIGLFFLFLLTRITPEVVDAGSESGWRAGWTGIATVYLFFSRNFLNIGFVITLLATLKKPKFYNIVMLLVSMSLPILNAVSNGRREGLIFLCLSILLAIFFVYRRTVPKVFIIITVIVAMLLINSSTVGQYRSISATARWEDLVKINVVKNFENSLNNTGSQELSNAALIMETVVKTGEYQWGSAYWNELVFSWIPAQFIGKMLKKSLQFNFGIDLKSFCDYAAISYNYFCIPGQTPTGIADAFAQFDYLGSLVFGLISYILKILWYESVYKKNILAESAYILIIVKGMLAITHQTANFPVSISYYAVFSLPIILWARMPRKSML